MSSVEIGGRGGGGSTGSRPAAAIRFIRNAVSAAPVKSWSSNHSRSITSSRRGHGDSRMSSARFTCSSGTSTAGFARMNSATRRLSGRTFGCRLAGSVSRIHSARTSVWAASQKSYTFSCSASGNQVSVSGTHSISRRQVPISRTTAASVLTSHRSSAATNRRNVRSPTTAQKNTPRRAPRTMPEPLFHGMPTIPSRSCSSALRRV